MRLRELLQSRGYVFVSETDTEVIAHLVHWELEQGGTLREAVLRTIPQLRGAYGTVIMDTRDPGTLLAARSGSPLVVARGWGKLHCLRSAGAAAGYPPLYLPRRGRYC